MTEAVRKRLALPRAKQPRAKPVQQRTAKYEYRIVWGYEGQKHKRIYKCGGPTLALKKLRFLTGHQPWMGANVTLLKRSWMRLMYLLEGTWDEVANLSVRRVFQILHASKPPLAYLRVEYRRVGPWTMLVEPEHNLRSPVTDKSDARLEALLVQIDNMTREEIDDFRVTPDIKRRYANKDPMDRWQGRQRGAAATAERARAAFEDYGVGRG